MNYITYTFIIPHHNSPELLTRCLDTIPQREDIQIIVVDDNSKAELRPSITRSDVEVVYIDAEHTKGAGHARNVGIERARGKWLLFADCDDYYIENFVETLDVYKNDDIDVLYFNFNLINESVPGQMESAVIQTVLDSNDYDLNSEKCVRFKNNSPWDKMVRGSFVLSKRLTFEEVPNGNDILFSLKVGIYSEKIKIIPNRLYNYIITANSLTTKQQSRVDVVCRIEHFVKMLEFQKEIGLAYSTRDILSFIYGIYKTTGIFSFLFTSSVIVFRVMSGNLRPRQWAKMLVDSPYSCRKLDNESIELFYKE